MAEPTIISGSIFTKVIKHNVHHVDEKTCTMPVVVQVNNFTEESAAKFYGDMSKAENTDQEIIPIVIDSFGGQIYSLFAMIDCIRASKKKIATVCVGKSMSCGAVLLSCGHDGYRFGSPMSTMLIHDASGHEWGKVEEIKMGAAEIDRLNKSFYNIMDRNCGHEEGYFQKLVHEKSHADWFLTPEEAKLHNLINHIRLPKIEITVSAETRLV